MCNSRGHTPGSKLDTLRTVVDRWLGPEPSAIDGEVVAVCSRTAPLFFSKPFDSKPVDACPVKDGVVKLLSANVELVPELFVVFPISGPSG